MSVAGLTKRSNVMSVASIEPARLGPMSAKYVLKYTSFGLLF